jgi:hypothetical protein
MVAHPIVVKVVVEDGIERVLKVLNIDLKGFGRYLKRL